MDGSEENTPCNTPARQAVTPDEKTLMSSKRYHAVLHRTLEVRCAAAGQRAIPRCRLLQTCLTRNPPCVQASAAATCDTESLRAAALRAQVAGLRAELETARAQAVSLSTKVEVTTQAQAREAGGCWAGALW